MSMIERVANTLKQLDGGAYDDPNFKALAAINTMREPTEEMLAAAAATDGTPKAVWYAMIGEAGKKLTKTGS